MSNSLVFHTEIIEIDTHQPFLSNGLINTLEQFIRQYYRLDNLAYFNEHVLGIGKTGNLAIFYDYNHNIIGFTRIFHQLIYLKGKTISVYSGNTYYDQKIDPSFIAAKFGLIKAMKDKLAHPEEEMVYFANANTPARYQFLANLSNTIYPKKGIRIPEMVLNLVGEFKKQNHWPSLSFHPMLIGNPMPLLNFPEEDVERNNPLINYYLTLNPDYRAGNSLLVYIPLNLANISQGIKQVLSQPIA